MGPWGPTSPWAPVAPLAPVRPVAPIAPVAPVAPLAPVAPVAPDAPFWATMNQSAGNDSGLCDVLPPWLLRYEVPLKKTASFSAYVTSTFQVPRQIRPG